MNSPKSWIRGLPVGLLWAASLLVIAYALYQNYTRFISLIPYDNWEAGLNVVSWRVAHGESMYGSMTQPGGLEPGFYTPLMACLLSLIFHFAHFSLFYGRTISLVAGLGFFLIFLRVFLPGRPRTEVVFAAALLLAADLQLTGLWTSPRNDIGMLFFGLCYLTATARAMATGRPGWLAAALGLFALAFWWKQTAVFLAPVPLVVAVLTRPRISWTLIVAVTGPFVVFALSLLGARLLAPDMYQMIFVIPSRYAISPRVVARYLLGMLDFLPLVLLSLHFCLQTKTDLWRSSKLLPWLAATALVALPTGLAAAGKTGGGTNSLSFFLYAGYGLVIVCLPHLFQRIRSPEEPFGARLGLAAIFSAYLVILPLNVLHTPSRVDEHRWAGDAGRPVVMDFARHFPGKLVSPQDPTIPLETKGYAGVSLVLEWDHCLWKWPLPKVLKEIDEADCVVTCGTNGSWRQWPFDDMDQILSQRHYHSFQTNALAGSEYRIWLRDNPGPVQK